MTITPELLISSTTGISRPLGDPAKTNEYLNTGQHTKLRRRLASDVKSLYAFYRYGCGHNVVRLRWGFLDDMLTVDWAVKGDVGIYATLKECMEAGTPVDLVSGSAPGWDDPWSRARRVQVLSLGVGAFLVEADGERWEVGRMDIQAVRPASE